ncbi:MAG: thioredoxin family protein [Phycisphaerales bacterium]|nr:thioredoxin family protein [Phycisphaerales bacterium]
MTSTWLKNGIILLAVIAGVVAVAVVRQERAKPADIQEGASATLSAPAALPRMVDLGADKCIPCKQMAPILVELRQEYAGRATIEFVDVWKDPGAGEPYGVRMIPTQVFFDRDGKEVWRHEGFLPKTEIVAKLKELGAE